MLVPEVLKRDGVQLLKVAIAMVFSASTMYDILADGGENDKKKMVFNRKRQR